MPKKNNHLLLFTGLFFLVTACYPTRKLDKGKEWLLKSNSVALTSKTKIDTDQLKAIIKQRPNRSIGFSIPPLPFSKSHFQSNFIFLRFNLKAYNLGKPNKGKIAGWLEKRVGEPPVIYDSLLTLKSVKQLNEFMFQSGYFNSKVNVELKYQKHRKMVKVAYVIQPGPSYLIDSIFVNIPQGLLSSLYAENASKSVLKTGHQYNYKTLENERQRLVSLYQNNGFFSFTRDFIRFDIDSSLGNYKLNLYLNVLNPIDKDDTANHSLNHIRYSLNKIYVYPTYDFFTNQQFTDTITNGNINIVYNQKLPINERLIYNNLIFSPYYYSKRDADETYKSFSSLNLYKNIKVDFKVNKEDGVANKLDSYVYLSPLKRNSIVPEIRVETRANNGGSSVKSTYNFGVSGNMSFQRLNAFRNGEILKLSLSGGLEPFFLNDSSANKNFFNTTNVGTTASITFPRFLLPIRQDKFAKSARAKTIIASSYNILKNDDITRRASKITLSYEWNETAKKRHTVSPIEFSLIKAGLSEQLNQRLISIGDPFLKNTYSDQFILASSYSFVYSDQYTAKAKKALYNKSKIEGAGNLMHTIANGQPNWHQTENAYTILNIPFAQYVRIENEFKTNRQTFFNDVVAFRLYAGIAKPLSNAKSLPFEKSFFAGGSNGIRAWGSRSLGPGGFMDTTTFRGFLNRLGEIHLESNVEYRFKLTKLLEWAFFADAGNIWVFDENGGRANTEFSTKFYKQIALGCGFGARLDFQFLIFRVDVAFPFHDPSKPDGERWIFQNKTEYNQIVQRYNERNELYGKDAVGTYRIKPNYNIGIGYPF